MTPEAVAQAVAAAVSAAAEANGFALAEVPDVRVERPRQREHGDYATNVAMTLTKKVGVPPRDLASAIADQLRTTPGIASVDVAGPGFINISVEAASQAQLARDIVEAGKDYGKIGRAHV